MELTAHEINVTDIRLGDIMQHSSAVTLSGGRPKTLESAVLDIEGGKDDHGTYVEVMLEDGFYMDFNDTATVVVYRRDED